MYVEPGTGQELPPDCHYLPDENEPPLSTFCIYYNGPEHPCDHCVYQGVPDET